MPFKKGRKKTGGRQKGTPNKHKSELKRQVEAFCIDNFAEFVKEFNLIDDPAKKTAQFIKLFEYVLPKQQQIDLDGALQVEAVKVEFKQTGRQPRHEEGEFLDD
jgi:hypothetical protein